MYNIGCGILSTSVRSCYAIHQSQQPSEELLPCSSKSTRQKRAERLVFRLLQTDVGQCEKSKDAQSVQRIVLKCAHNAHIAPQNRVTKFLEFCSNEDDKTYQGTIDKAICLVSVS